MGIHKYLAFDIGASSGRGIIGTLQEGKISLKEINRFYNGMTRVHGNYHWDVYRLFEDLKKGLIACVQEKEKIESIGVDTWGVDYGLLGGDGSLLGIPFAYRDHRTDNAMEQVFQKIPKERIYELTGGQFQQYNSIYQLHSAKRDKQPILDVAKDLLFMPDIFNYLLSGIKKTEFTFATTSQLYNPRTREWEKELFDAIGIPMDLMQEIVQPGTIIGELTSNIQDETGINPVKIAAVGCHDTASAIAAIPASDENFAYISSGTWSLMGIESKEPVISPEALSYNFTNEGGVEDTFRVLKNIMGLWLIQECKRIWALDGKDYSYSELVKLSNDAQPF
ncbi:MAG: rhamnulokinase, partial [Bacteroidota bacterium]